MIAVDWGTTRRRAYLLAADGRTLDSVSDACGALATDRGKYPAMIGALRRRLGVPLVICAGMVGAAGGWREVAYADAPADLAAIAGRAVQVERGCWIVGGVAVRSERRGDVMRGEEIAALGACSAGLVPPDATLAMPGTHNKWVSLQDGRIASFVTTMTGELFALLKGHGTLAGLLDGSVEANAAFDAGVDRAGGGDLLAALFEIRSGWLLGTLNRQDAAAFASGLLIGADLAASPFPNDAHVHVVADEPLATLYAAALRRRGGQAVLVDHERAFTAGMHALRGMIPA